MERNKKDSFFEPGFTIIELLVTLSIIGLLSSVGLASYINFSRSQQVTASTRKVVEDLRLAQSLAANNQKPSGCDTLKSYTFSVLSQTRYQITAECSTTYTIKTEFLPSTMVMVGFTQVKFTVLRQGVHFVGGNTLAITGYGRTKTIVAGEAGEIKVNE